MALRPELQTQLGELHELATEASSVFLNQYQQLKASFSTVGLELFAHLQPHVQRIVVLAELGFGISKTAVQRIAASAWHLNADDLVDIFEPQILLSRRFVSALADFSAADTVSWEAAYRALLNARDLRWNTGQKGVSRTATWAVKDVADAMTALNMNIAQRSTKRKPNNTQNPEAKRRRSSSFRISADQSDLEIGRRDPSPLCDLPSDDASAGAYSDAPAPDSDDDDENKTAVHLNRPDTPFPHETTLPLNHPATPPTEDETTFQLEHHETSPVSSLAGSIQQPDRHDSGIKAAEELVTEQLGVSAKNPNVSVRPSDEHDTTAKENEKLLIEQGETMAGDSNLRPPRANEGDTHGVHASGIQKLDQTEVLPEQAHSQDPQDIHVLQQLQDGKWLGHCGISSILNAFKSLDYRILEVTLPADAGQEEWARWARGTPFRQHSKTQVLVPLHHGLRAHWLLLHLDLDACYATIHDSILPQKSTNYHAMTEAICKRMGVDWNASWMLNTNQEAPQQDGTDDCGVFVLVACLRLMARSQTTRRVNAGLWRILFRSHISHSSSLVGDIDRLTGSYCTPTGRQTLIEKHQVSKRAIERLQDLSLDVQDATNVFDSLLRDTLVASRTAQPIDVLEKDNAVRRSAVETLATLTAPTSQDHVVTARILAILEGSQDRIKEAKRLPILKQTLLDQEQAVGAVTRCVTAVLENAKNTLLETQEEFERIAKYWEGEKVKAR